MRVRILSSSVSDSPAYQFLSSYLVGDSVAIDAGSIGFLTPLASQRDVQHIFLSHSHIDHIASLPIFLENVYDPGPDCVTVYGTAETLDVLRNNIFNDTVWPDVFRLSIAESPFVTYHVLEPGVSVQLPGLRVTPILLNHTVPTCGFLVEENQTAVAFVYDTSATTDIWDRLNATEYLKGLFLECCFPNAMEWLALRSGHLSVAQFAREIRKLQREVRIVTVHLKPTFYDEIVEELKVAAPAGIEIGEPGKQYLF